MGQCACLGVTDVSTCVGLYLLLFQHFENWPKDKLICVHAEERTTAAVLLLAELYQRSVHVCHVAQTNEDKKRIFISTQYCQRIQLVLT